MRYFHLLFMIAVFSYDATAQCKTSQRAKVLVQTLQRVHYTPLQNSAEVQQQIALRFFLAIDAHRLLFTDADVKGVVEFAPQFIDTTSNMNCEFALKMQSLYKERMKQFNAWIDATKNSGLKFNAADTIYLSTSRELKSFCTDEAALNAFRMNYVRYRFLLLASYENEDGDKQSEIKMPLADYVKKNEQVLRHSLLENVRCEVDKSIRFKTDADYESFIMEGLLKAIAETYDPHTEYFDLQTMNAFSEGVSSDGRSFGLFIGENENNEKVVSGLLPGSAAWRQNTVNVDDKIVSITLGSKRITDFTCISAAELESMLDNSGENRASIHLQKVSGEEQVVQLRKESVQVEENVITGLILEGNNQKVGYVSLPAFYSSGSYYVDKGCANDVGKEIMKLKSEGIKGMILDLRFNGGGDVAEAVDLAGLFIDVGPTGMLVDSNGKPYILKELSKGTLYDGPLVILVNGFSASASEMLAAVLQDYNRCVVAGNATYGKSTAQGVFPMHSSISQMKATTEPLAYVKATVNMLYRITGYTHQSKGVQPDVQFPNLYGGLGITEASYPNTLQGSFVEKNLVYKKFKDLPLDTLRARSKNRMDTTQCFQTLMKNKSQWPGSELAVCLYPQSFEKDMTNAEAYENLMSLVDEKIQCPFEISAATQNIMVIKVDEYMREVFESQKQSALHDYELHEAFHITCDLITFQPK
ncbi:MAG: S41 family peptidase [Flavobacteriales bacterium]